MDFGDQFSTAIRALSANKLRSVLTMLGVVIGVGSVIAMIGVGEGTQEQSLANLERMGTNMLMVWPNWRRGNGNGGGDVPTLKDQDVETVRDNVPLAQYVTGEIGGKITAIYGANTASTQITGAAPVVKYIRNATDMFQGTWYTDKDEKLANRVCVLGFKAYQDLFGDGDAVGATVRINRDNFKVLGVITYKGGSGFWNPDDQIYCPLSTARERILGRTNIDTILVQVINPNLMIRAQGEIEDALSVNRKNASGDPLFMVMNQGDSLEQMKTQTAILGGLLASIASVSLLVGGIGIMNIMLVSVTERTREIGLRKAIGAHRWTIRSQFLLESVVLCCVGGFIGIIMGTITVHVVAPIMNVPPVVNARAVGLAVFFSLFVGVAFGFYPAYRASGLQPIEALRFE